MLESTSGQSASEKEQDILLLITSSEPFFV